MLSILRRNSWFLILFSVGLLLRLAIIFQPLEFLSDLGLLFDDSFISLNISRNLADGFGSTHDRVIRTNGYQPFWVFICVPFFWVFSNNALQAVRAILVFSSLLSVMTGFLLYLFLNKARGVWAARFGLIIWMFSPLVLRHTLNALETGLYVFLIVLLLWLIQRGSTIDRWGGDYGITLPIWICLGCVFFTRVDALLLIPGLFWLLWRKKVGLKEIVLGFGLAGLPLFLWCAESFLRGGSFLPESGHAIRVISLCYGTKFSWIKEINVSPEHIPFKFILSNFIYSLVMHEKYVRYLLFPILNPFEMVRDPYPAYLFFPGFITVMTCFGVLWGRRKRAVLQNKNFHFVFGLAIPFALLLVLGYSVYAFGQWFYHRYYFPNFIFFCLVMALVVSHIIKKLHSRGLSESLVAPILSIWFIVSYGIHDIPFFKPRPDPLDYISIARWLNQNCPEDTRIGCFQAGTIGFFTEQRRIICLDGVVNGAARMALENKAIDSYLKKEGITIVIDWKWVMDAQLFRRAPPGVFVAPYWREIKGLPPKYSGIWRERYSNFLPKGENEPAVQE
ncbi:ArnT family glycosyltransferase [candidate division CSSED10-310 bacterium]|uniref:ArnT family glycosyltransferase n=1 Tax=candidate division CSSED10-310 bacterium TaxID=2855610 RepID=A0ABV6YRH1_UNCC1